MRRVGGNSLLMNRQQKGEKKKKKEDGRGDTRSVLCSKILLLLGSAEGKVLRGRKRGKS